MFTFWFGVLEGEYLGEEFFVEANDLDEAYEIAETYFDDELECYGVIDEFEAEMLGYDTY